MRRRILALAILLPALAAADPPQYGAARDVAVGRVLVAKKELGDPNFAETVILIVDYDAEKGTSGLILNRRTTVALSKLFPDLKTASADPVFQGGPVEATAAQAVFRASAPPQNALHVFGDVYVTGNKDVIEKAVASAADPSRFRLYVGYGGWGAGQLEHEVELGAWDVLNAKTSIVFDDDPDSLWSRLEVLAHSRIARNLPPAPVKACTALLN